jgi:hypothetical protein
LAGAFRLQYSTFQAKPQPPPWDAFFAAAMVARAAGDYAGFCHFRRLGLLAQAEWYLERRQ